MNEIVQAATIMWLGKKRRKKNKIKDPETLLDRCIKSVEIKVESPIDEDPEELLNRYIKSIEIKVGE